MKKKMFALLVLAILAAFSLTACGDSSGSDEKDTTPPSAAQPEESPAETPAEPSNDATQGGKMVGSGDLGDYHVEIKSAFLTKDYEDKPAIVVTYAWTNNSDDTTSAMVAVHEKAFQDGVQLDIATLFDVDGYEAGTSMKEVRPGTTIDVQCAFALTSDTSTVEFEISEFISLSDDVVTMDFDPASLS